jgi:hypothetical protein
MLAQYRFKKPTPDFAEYIPMYECTYIHIHIPDDFDRAQSPRRRDSDFLQSGPEKVVTVTVTVTLTILKGRFRELH